MCRLPVTPTIGLVYRSPNIGQDKDVKLQKAIREVSKGECVIMGDFNQIHFNIKVKTGNTYYKKNGGGTSTNANENISSKYRLE